MVDIGGGSTELIVGAAGGDDRGFHVSPQAGVVRQTERHLHRDPPPPDELQQLADDVRATIEAACPRTSARARGAPSASPAPPPRSRRSTRSSTPTTPPRPRRRAGAAGVELLLARLAQMPLEQRREVRGLHPDRAPTIVAGAAILLEVLRAFGLGRAEVSEHDLLHGVALERAAR